MHIELVDALRCPRPHEDSWLVASMSRLEDREIVHGVLGCPICGAEYPVEERTVQMGGTPGPGVAAPLDEEAMRLAAMLDLAEAGGLVLLAGSWGACAEGIRAFLDQRLVLVNPPATVATGQGIYALLLPEGLLPIAPGTARAIALDDAHASLAPLAVGALRAGGRLVAPADTPLPPETRELARDATVWVAERAAQPRLVGIKRA